MTSMALKQTELSPIRQLLGILKNNRIFESFYSHVSLVQPKGKYSFAGREVLEDFWLYYQRSIIDGECVGLAEVPQSFIPVIVDIDLQFSLDSKEEDKGQYYKEEFVKVIVAAYQQVLRDTIDIKDDSSLLECAWLNKKPYIKDNNGTSFWKNGFHLQFYNLFVSKIDLEIKIIPRVIKLLDETLTEDLIDGVLNPTDFFDKKAVGNTWLLYGSSKSETHRPYVIHRIFDEKLNDIELADAFARVKIYDSNEDRITFSRENFRLYLPRIFSIIPAGRKVHDIKKVECIRDYIVFSKPEQSAQRPKEVVREETKHARELVKIISAERAVGHNDWMSIGWALYNISEGSEQGLDIWIYFSVQKPDHDEARCIYEWNRMTNKGKITLGTLKFYARQDNEVAYLNYISQIETAKKVNLSEKGLADLLVSHIQGEFVYCKKKWYEFAGHYWIICDEGINVIKKMETILTPLLKKMKQTAQNEAEDGEDDNNLAKKISTTLARLNSAGFVKNVLEWCKVRFHDQEFENGLDRNRYLIGFNNGVYDLKLNIFRKGDPSDMITNHMPIDYKVYNEGSDEVLEVKNFFEKVFPNTNIRRYVYDIMSEIFVGYNHRKHVYFFTGSGDNGKSVTQMFFEKMLGRLSIKVPTTVLTSKKPAVGGTSEELARTGGGTRALWLEEPNPDEKISEGIFKHLSGNDSFYARGLYQTGREIDPMFKLFIICNSLPKLRHGGDKATWNRVRVIPFESTFSSNAPKDPEEQLRTRTFPKDTTLDQRIPHLTSALAWFLLEHYKLPKIDDPPEVLEATNCYKGENDVYAQFISDCFVAEEGASARDLVAIDHFRSFMTFDMNNSKMNIPSTSEFVKIISRYIGDIDGDCWHGYRLRPPRAATYADSKNRAGDGISEGGARDM